VLFHNPAGFTHVIYDVFGAFTSPAATPGARTVPVIQPGELSRVDR
jgi:hypothetical protein